MLYKKSTEQNENNLLKVENNFATLVNVVSQPSSIKRFSELHFEFFFKISQIAALKNNALSVDITVKKNNQILPSILEGNQRFNANKIIDNILSNKIKINNLIKKDQQSIVVKTTADITSKINNSLLRSSINFQEFESLRLKKNTITIKSKKQLSEESAKKTINSYSYIVDNRQLSNNLQEDLNKRRRINLLMQGISPASITSLPNKSVSPYDLLQGSIKKSSNTNFSEHSDISKLHDFHLSDVSSQQDNSQYEVVLDQVNNDIVTVKAKAVINGSFENETCLITFELIQTVFNADGTKQKNVLEKVQKTFDINKYISSFYSSKVDPPEVKFSFNDKNLIFQVTSGRNYYSPIKVFKRRIDDEDSNYSKINEINFSSPREEKKITVLNQKNDESIYRFIYSESFSEYSNSEFSDVVTKALRKKRLNNLILIPSIINGGINVEVRNTSFLDISKCFILIRDATLKKKYTIAGEVKFFSSGDIIKVLTIINGLIPYHNYELTSKIVFKNGTEEYSTHVSCIEYIPYIGDIGKYSITNLSVVPGDVTFTPVFSVQTNQISLINSLLTKVTSTYNTDSLETRKNSLDTFIAFHVMRYNLQNGVVEDLGIITNNELFSDKVMSRMHSAKPLLPNSSYKYVLYPLVRDPASVLEENVELRDKETRKFYKSNFRKSRHPLSLVRGISVSKEFIDNDTKNDMLYGKIGTSMQVNVSTEFIGCNVRNFYASFVEINKVCLTWNVSGDINQIDHFLIYKECDKVKTLIGKSHCLKNNFSFVYNLTKSDIGIARFSLTPITKKFSSSPSIISNELLITT